MSHDPDPELLRRIEKALPAMSRRQREMFLACRMDNMPYEESRTGPATRTQVERHVARSLYKLLEQRDGRPLSWWMRWF